MSRVNCHTEDYQPDTTPRAAQTAEKARQMELAQDLLKKASPTKPAAGEHAGSAQVPAMLTPAEDGHAAAEGPPPAPMPAAARLPQNAALTALVGKLQDAVVAVDLAAVKQQLQGSRDALAAPGAVGPDGQTPIWTCMNHRAGWEVTLGESKEVRPEPARSRLARACEMSV